jgi:branched-chain amino acid transport system substrate-binding protein
LLAVLSLCGTVGAATTPAAAQTSGSGGSSESAPGVTPKTITIGLVTSATGAGAPYFFDTKDGAQARFDLENSKGGVFNRKIKLIALDNQTNPTQETTGWQSLNQQGMFAAIGYDPLLFIAYRNLQSAGVPVVGDGLDGPEWGQQPNTNMFNWANSLNPPKFPAYTGFGKFVKSLGATKMGLLSAASPSASAAMKADVISLKKAGVDAPYTNYNIPFGTVNFTGEALAMKSAGVDGFGDALEPDGAIGLATSAKQQGLSVKAPMVGTGYAQKTLDDAQANAAGQGGWFAAQTVPFELGKSGTKAMEAALKKYAGKAYSGGIPDGGLTGGWLSADLIIQGLKDAGKNLTREGFMKALSSTTGYTANGVLPSPVDLSHFGQDPPKSCMYWTQLKGKKFTNAKLVCGTLIPNSDQISSPASS